MRDILNGPTQTTGRVYSVAYIILASRPAFLTRYISASERAAIVNSERILKSLWFILPHFAMPIENTNIHFLYRQLLTTPSPVTKSDRDLTDLTAIVSGSNTGLGYHASQQLLSLGLSRLILAVRDPAKGETAKASLLSSLNAADKPQIEVWELDMTSYESILQFTKRVRDTSDLRVDFAILNAGVVKVKFEQCRGNEMSILTNWLGTALLTATLRPVLQAQYDHARGSASTQKVEPPVLSIVGSDVAQLAAFKEKDIAAKENTSVLKQLNEEKNFDRMDRYNTTKLLLLMFFLEFCERVDKAGGNEVIVNIMTPGLCYGSDLHRSVEGMVGKIFKAGKRAIGRSTPVGARTLVHAAVVAGKESHGKYLMDERIAPFADYVETEKGKAMTKQMWKELEQELAPVIDLERIIAQKA